MSLASDMLRRTVNPDQDRPGSEVLGNALHQSQGFVSMFGSSSLQLPPDERPTERVVARIALSPAATAAIVSLLQERDGAGSGTAGNPPAGQPITVNREALQLIGSALETNRVPPAVRSELGELVDNFLGSKSAGGQRTGT